MCIVDPSHRVLHNESVRDGAPQPHPTSPNLHPILALIIDALLITRTSYSSNLTTYINMRKILLAMDEVERTVRQVARGKSEAEIMKEVRGGWAL